jgi:plastocyanin
MPSRRGYLRGSIAALTVAVAGCSSGGGDDEDTTDGDGGGGEDTTTDAGGMDTTTDGGGGPQIEATVTVGPGGNFRFDPSEVTVAVGGTVTWEWDSGGHNVTPDTIPQDADWSGTEGAPGETYGAGHTYSHTFETAGTYDYFCNPHRGAGMVGTVVVGDEGGGGTTSGDGGMADTTTGDDGGGAY